MSQQELGGKELGGSKGEPAESSSQGKLDGAKRVQARRETNAEDRVTSKRIRDQSIAEKIDRLSWSK